MELVYLWVEKYKNIENQGFNFSPRFECEYKDGNLTIEEKKDYVNIFPDNINITAIVGENGSGKSSLIKLILILVFFKKYEFLDTTYDPKQEDSVHKLISSGLINKNIFLIIHNDGKLKKLSLLHTLKECISKTFPLRFVGNGIPFRQLLDCPLDALKYPELKFQDLDFFSIHFNYMLDTLYDGAKDEWVKYVYHRNDGYSTPILLEPYKNANNEEKIDLKIIEFLNNQRMLKFYSEITVNENITSFFNPNKIKIKLSKVIASKLTWQKKLKSSGYDYFNEIDEIYKLEDKFRSLQKKYNIDRISNDFTKNIIEQIRKLYKNNEYSELNKLYIAFKVLSSDKSLFNETTYNHILVNFNRKTSTYSKRTYIDLLIDFNVTTLLVVKNTYEVAKIERCIDFNNKNNAEDSLFKESMNKINDINTLSKILTFIPPWIEVEFFEDDKSIKSLSSGEKGFFSFLINILYQLNNIKNKQNYFSINLFLDETDVGFHPEWQKKYLNEIMTTVKKIWNKKINIVFLTHSPFILSDLPKENVIFLEKGKQVYPFENMQTFGANIHTLLSHGFFMKDGLMGEFAKEKINEAIKYLNQKTLTEEEIEYCENIISIIGEPILKRQLQNMLDSKRLSKIESVHQKIRDMEYELSILKKYQKKATNDELMDRAKRKYYKKKDD
jgi:hypothetical protein